MYMHIHTHAHIYSHIYTCTHMHIYLSIPSHRQHMTQCQILSEVQQVLIQSFHSLRLVAYQRLKNSVCPTIYQ